jgi:arylsulfatase A-like enzyme
VTLEATKSAEPKIRSQPASGAAMATGRLGRWDLLVLAAWCGLASGLLEVGTKVVCRLINPVHQLYLMSRHFFWVTPLVNLLLLFGLGICLAALTTVAPRLGGKIGPRLVVASGILPMLIVAERRIFPEAWFVLALGVAVWLVPLIERFPGVFRRRMVQTFPLLLAVDLVLAAAIFGGDWLKLRREAARPQPPAGSPNVLFIVLDTVRADRLSLYGYHRPTTPTLERLAKRGIRFDAARAPAPWTLPSHASFFSGRWPHELEVEWATPLPEKYPMLAEYLGAHGYATAGIVSNMYCSYDAGLNRGFTHYEDYVFERLSFLRTSTVVEEAVKNSVLFGLYSPSGFLNRTQAWLRSIFRYATRKDARTISDRFLNWLDHRQQPGRPFFVFLNYLDAHAPYKVPPGESRRFGRKPQTDEELWVIYDEWDTLEKLLIKKPLLTMGRDCYDSCLAYLDDEIGRLIGDLERRRGVLENTWIVITSDHGEGLGEHELFDHGESLYSHEIHVPLVILPPASITLGKVVRQPVSLRDLPTTVVDLIGLAAGAPFPGHSLRVLWENNASDHSADAVSDALSELASPSPIDSSHGRSPARRGPLVSLAEGDLLYIRNEGDGAEELYNLRDDPHELTNRARSASMQPVLARFRARLTQIKK